MALYQHFIYEDAEVAIWKIEEDEDFFRQATGLTSFIHAEKRRIEYYAGRFLLQRLIPHLDLEKIKIDNIGKPYLEDGSFHFSISHSFPYIAVVIHETAVVGIDIQVYRPKILRILEKYLHTDELYLLPQTIENMSMLWCTKEALYKWRGTGGQDFSEQLRILNVNENTQNHNLTCAIIDTDKSIHNLSVMAKQDWGFAMAIAVK